MNRRGHGRSLVALVALALLSSVSALAQSRGLEVTVKASDQPGATEGGRIQLYRSSHALVIGIGNYTVGADQCYRTTKARIANAEKRLSQASDKDDKEHLTGLIERLRLELNTAKPPIVTKSVTDRVTATKGQGEGQGLDNYSPQLPRGGRWVYAA